jgi:SAM-dependent methyltransferase
MGPEPFPRSCPLCGSQRESRVFAEAKLDPATLDSFSFASRKAPEYTHHRLLLCVTCDLLYVSPSPSLAALSTAYEHADFDSTREASYASFTYARFLRLLRSRLPDLVGALDIGTGDGVFLERLLSAGFTDVIGIEPSVAPTLSAKLAIRPLIRQGMFRGEDFAAGSFSLITCFQTIEHVMDPLQLCRSAHHLLKPGGAFFLIGHNRRAMSARIMGLKSPIYDIEHLQLFSHASARIMLERAGFCRIEWQPIYNRYPVGYWAKLLPIPTSLKKGLLRILNASGLGALPIALPAGNMACIGYKPAA